MSIMDWINENWMFVAPVTSLSIAVYKYREATPRPRTLDDSQVHNLILWGWFSMFIYSIHQFEEHGYDLKGRRYHFIEYFNAVIAHTGVQLTPTYVTLVNVIQVQIFFALYTWWSEATRDPLCVALNYSLMAFNATVAHVLPGIVKWHYNPGFCQSLFMAPISFWVLYKYYQYHESVQMMLVCFFFGSVWGHFLTLFLPLKLVSMGWLDEFGFVVWNAGFCIVFPFLANKVLTKKNRKD